MSKFIVEVTENYEFAKDILKGWQYFVFQKSARKVYSIIHSRMKTFNFEMKGKVWTYYEEGTIELVELEMKRFEAFMYADSTELHKPEYRKHMNDRLIQKVQSKVHKIKDKIKDKSIRAALGGSDVYSFYAKLGILVTWRVEALAIN